MATKLILKNKLQLTINPVIHTFIGFLPLNRVEFIDKIKNEIESNPMLEVEKPNKSTDKDNDNLNVIERKLDRADSTFLNSYEEQGFLFDVTYRTPATDFESEKFLESWKQDELRIFVQRQGGDLSVYFDYPDSEVSGVEEILSGRGFI